MRPGSMDPSFVLMSLRPAPEAMPVDLNAFVTVPTTTTIVTTATYRMEVTVMPYFWRISLILLRCCSAFFHLMVFVLLSFSAILVWVLSIFCVISCNSCETFSFCSTSFSTSLSSFWASFSLCFWSQMVLRSSALISSVPGCCRHWALVNIWVVFYNGCQHTTTQVTTQQVTHRARKRPPKGCCWQSPCRENKTSLWRRRYFKGWKSRRKSEKLRKQWKAASTQLRWSVYSASLFHLLASITNEKR